MGTDAVPPVRTEDLTASLDVTIRWKCQQLVKMLEVQGIFIRITSTRRTWDEQDKLFRQGREDPGPIVTNARGGQSWHNYGLAFDWAFKKGGCDEYSGRIEEVGKAGEALGLIWGGRWKSFDCWHFEFHNGMTIKQARAAYLKAKKVEETKRVECGNGPDEEDEDDRPEDAI